MATDRLNISADYNVAYRAAERPSRALVAQLVGELESGDAGPLLSQNPSLQPLAVAITDFKSRLHVETDKLGIDARYAPEYREAARGCLTRLSSDRTLKVSPQLAQHIKGKMLAVFLDACADTIPLQKLLVIKKVTFQEINQTTGAEAQGPYLVEVELEYSDGTEHSSGVTFLTV